MKLLRMSCPLGLPVLLASCTAPGSVSTSDPAPILVAHELGGLRLTGVPAVAKAPGVTAPNVLSPELMAVVAAQGAIAVENPQLLPIGEPAVSVTHYGYDGDGPLVPAPGDLPSATHQVEASKTEPDKNTYLVLRDQSGADPDYDYGSHFLFQGHESGARGAGTITRINLDADAAHKVTVMAVADASGAALPPIDGSTWDPWAERLLLTAELGPRGGVWQATLDVPSAVEDISGALGRGGYEGIQNDSEGNVWVIEDVGGGKGTVNKNARQPNSFVYRFVPVRPDDLHRGKLQALQVLSLRTGQPIAFHAGQADADITSDDVRDLHSYGKALETRWVTVHDTEVDGTAPFDANAAAKAKLATPFKRPENGLFRPGSQFREFVFDETGDTDLRTEAGSELGGFGAVLKLTQRSPGADRGTLTLVYRGDAAHSSLDNLAFWDADHAVFVEDAGDTLHAQRNALDSGFLVDLRVNYANPASQPLRILAEGRDPSATLDAALAGSAGFQNDGDNEITGIHISDGDPTRRGILGARVPRPFQGGFRVFFTQQHGDNVTWEILPRPRTGSYDD
ncbi:MAG TPA: hypothetical protein VFK02_21650 [Kofleriaceae bacterium]|nr:hypothetical protein [Kofleriaceae bacterium]